MFLAMQQRGSETFIAIELKINIIVWVKKWIDKKTIHSNWLIKREAFELIIRELKHNKWAAV